ncbi:hypothetical protein V5N11_027274 [Cardamine amara subsp. amara]|uniref:Micro-fibrillar-associated protein 1 C-terminal domain-containing protein n=1 Tax=Cardamine amara subsp. amara TaxID=228776 RepID=A0ABD1AYG4_CARAN
MSVTAGVSDTIIALREKLRGKIGQTKVKRYWPGKAPVWAKEDEEDVMIHKVVVLDCTDDPRLRRLAQARTENREEVRADHRRIRQAEIIYTDQEKELRNQESKDGEQDEERRRRIREKNLKRPHEEATDEDEDEYETGDSEEDEIHIITMIKPFFVLKGKRDTIAERKELEAKEKALKELAKRKLEMRKLETKQIVVEEVKKDEEIWKKMVFEDVGDVEIDDELNEAEEYEVWRTREIARIKRERDPKEAMLRV